MLETKTVKSYVCAYNIKTSTSELPTTHKQKKYISRKQVKNESTSVTPPSRQLLSNPKDNIFPLIVGSKKHKSNHVKPIAKNVPKTAGRNSTPSIDVIISERNEISSKKKSKRNNTNSSSSSNTSCNANKSEICAPQVSTTAADGSSTVSSDGPLTQRRCLPAEGVRRIVCYGLGSPAGSHGSRVQTALLLHLRALCNEPPLELYDPVFCDNDLQLFSSYCFSVIKENEECCRGVDELTLFFIPHGSWAMYNNLLWANWTPEKLRNVIILGNDFRRLEDIYTKKRFSETFKYLDRIITRNMFMAETLCPITDSNTELISTALATFPLTLLPPANDLVWELSPRPTYSNSDEQELVRLIDQVNLC